MQVREPRMAESRASAVIDSSKKFLLAAWAGRIFSPLMSGTKYRIFASFAVLSHRKLLLFHDIWLFRHLSRNIILMEVMMFEGCCLAVVTLTHLEVEESFVSQAFLVCIEPSDVEEHAACAPDPTSDVQHRDGLKL